jgi:5-amino-6-(5-phosphoribosylamino)uracil reductase
VALDQALAWADACLIGAGTLRAHQCTCLIRNRTLGESNGWLPDARLTQPR